MATTTTKSTIKYLANWNLPGFLPDSSDDPYVFDTIEEAWKFIAGEIETDAEFATENEMDEEAAELDDIAREVRGYTKPGGIHAGKYIFWVRESNEDDNNDE